jgi:hypothetical protein
LERRYVLQVGLNPHGHSPSRPGWRYFDPVALLPSHRLESRQ